MMGHGGTGETQARQRPGRSGIWQRVSGRGAAAAGASALLMLGAMAPLASATSDGPTVRVIVVSRNAHNASDNVNAHHGKVAGDLSIANAVAADVSATDLAALRQDTDIEVVPNVQVDVTGVADTSAATAFAMLRSPTALPWWAFTLSPALWAFLETTMTRAVGPSDVADASGAIAPSINNAEAPAAAAPRPDTRCQIPERPGR